MRALSKGRKKSENVKETLHKHLPVISPNDSRSTPWRPNMYLTPPSSPRALERWTGVLGRVQQVLREEWGGEWVVAGDVLPDFFFSNTRVLVVLGQFPVHACCRKTVRQYACIGKLTTNTYVLHLPIHVYCLHTDVLPP
jgi:hypothetical protein